MFRTLVVFILMLVCYNSLANPWSKEVSRGISEAADGNYVEALSIFEKAALGNDYHAQWELANLRGNDIDGVKDLKESYAWYRVVTCRNIRDFRTKAALDRILMFSQSMSDEDLECAERKAEEYMGKFCV